MSRIYDALRQAERERAAARKGSRSKPPPRGPERRRSPRRALRVPLFVYGYGKGRLPFHEETHSVQVNGGGGLLLLSLDVRRGQKLLLVNALSGREQECEIVRVGPEEAGKMEIGVKFPRSIPDFWQPGAGRKK